MTGYALPSRALLFRDSPERIDFHIQSGDFLSYLATRIGFIEEFLARCDGSNAVARELRNDLRYAQAHYKVVPRGGAEVGEVRPAGNLLAK